MKQYKYEEEKPFDTTDKVCVMLMIILIIGIVAILNGWIFPCT